MATVLYLTLALYVLTRAPVIVNRLLFLILAIGAVWSLSYHQELDAVSLDTKLLWMRGRFLVLPFLLPLWLMLTIHLIGFERRATRTFWGLLFAVPVLTAPLAVTMHLHTWFRFGFTSVPGLPLQPVLFLRGPWELFYDTFNFAVELIAVAALAWSWRTAGPLLRKQIVLLAIANLLPATAYLLFVTHAVRLGGINPAPLLLLPAAAAMAAAVFRFQLADVAPVARGMLFDHIHDGILVTDLSGRIVDLNTAAAEMLGVPAAALVGSAADPAPPPWPRSLGTADGEKATFSSPAGTHERWYERTRLPILKAGKQRGWMFVFQDITDRIALHRQRLSEVRLAEEKKRALQWSLLLRDLHDGIGSVSANIGMLAALARKAPTAEAKDKFIGQIAELANEGNIEVRTMMNSLDAREMSWAELLAEIRRFAALVLEPRGIQFALRADDTPAVAPAIAVSTSIFRIIKESVSNAAKHARATSVSIDFRFSGADLTIDIRDNGQWQGGRPEGRGLRHMRQRVADLGGSLCLETAPSTRLVFSLPGIASPGPESTPPHEDTRP